MNERASRYNDDEKASGVGGGIWGQEPLPPQMFRSNEALLANSAALVAKKAAGGAGGGGKVSKRKREAEQPPQLQDRAEQQRPKAIKREPSPVAPPAVAASVAPAPAVAVRKPSPFKKALVLGGRPAAAAPAAAAAPVDESDDDDKPLAAAPAAKRPGTSI